MFHVPNKKAFEIVTYFLLSKLNHPRPKEGFRNCWPIFDKKTEQLFRKTTFNWLQLIAQEDVEIPFPHFTLSTLMSPGGEKFYELYLALSSYVVQKLLISKNNIKCFCAMPISTWYSAKRLLQMSQHLSIQKFCNIQKKALLLHKSWHDFTSHLVKRYRFLKNEIQEKKKMLKEQQTKLNINYKKISMDNLLIDASVESGFNICSGDLEKVNNDCKMLEEFCSQESLCWKIIYPELKFSTGAKRCLDGSKLTIKLADGIKNKYKIKLLKRGVERTHDQDGQLDLKSFLQILNVSLLEYQTTFSADIQKNLQKNVSQIITCNISHNNMLNSLRSLSSRLFVSLHPDVKESVNFLKNSISMVATPVVLDVQGITLEPLPPSPHISFSPSNECDPSHVVNFELTPPTGNTPVVVLKKKAYHHGWSPLLNNPLECNLINNFCQTQEDSNNHNSSSVISSVSVNQELVENKQNRSLVPCQLSKFLEEYAVEYDKTYTDSSKNFLEKHQERVGKNILASSNQMNSSDYAKQNIMDSITKSFKNEKIVNRILDDSYCVPSFEDEQAIEASTAYSFLGNAKDVCTVNTPEKITPFDKMCSFLDAVCSPKSNLNKSCLHFKDEGATVPFPPSSRTEISNFSESEEDLTDITLPSVPLVDLDCDFPVSSGVSALPLSPLKELTRSPLSYPLPDVVYNSWSTRKENCIAEHCLVTPADNLTDFFQDINLPVSATVQKETEPTSRSKNNHSCALFKSEIGAEQETRCELYLNSLENNHDIIKDEVVGGHQSSLPSQNSMEPDIGILVEI